MGATYKIEVLLTDGTGPAGCASRASIRAVEATGLVPADVQVKGSELSFWVDDPVFGFESWDVAVGNIADGIKSFNYHWLKVKANKKITEALEPDAAPMNVSFDPPPIDPIDPPPPPSSGRLLAIYLEDSSPVSGVAWSTGAESGTTNSLGEVRVTDTTGELTLTMLNFVIEGLVAVEDPVTITASSASEP